MSNSNSNSNTTRDDNNENSEQRVLSLPSGCVVTVDEHRALVELPDGIARRDASDTVGRPTDGWNALSSAIWKGGMRSFRSATTETTQTHKQKRKVAVLNYKVPATYDGMNPEPRALLRGAIAEVRERRATAQQTHQTLLPNEDSTVGLMTAASMRSLRTASRSAGGITVDAIVTAGISNARAAGADADCFGMLPRPPPGTINAVVVIQGAPLSEAARVEAYAIAVEAKCGACAAFHLPCAKSSGDLAQGTGTDCLVLLAPSEAYGDDNHNDHDNNNDNDNNSDSDSDTPFVLEYAGKHCLLAELVGQAVREATAEAIRTNLLHLHGTVARYHLARWRASLWGLVRRGARPCVPPRPMDPMPPSPLQVVLLGWGGVVGLAYFGAGQWLGLPRSATVLMAAFVWDRCLPEPPLSVHPVVLAGTAISMATKKWIPEPVFQNPVVGGVGGILFLVGMLALFGSGAHWFLVAVRWMETEAETASAAGSYHPWVCHLPALGAWLLEVILVKTTFSLQLLCTIALQMARFLERSQLEEARSQLVWLCSRDPTHLGSEDLAGGTLESLSENLSDGTLAPWFWYIALGPVGALGYRVANTLDSRIGYRGGRYEWFGKASARFDDIINLIPARLTALVLVVASGIVLGGASASRGLETARNDHTQCSSPNAGWPMGAMAGILGVRLEKKGEYALGNTIPGVRGPTPRDIRAGHRVAELAGGMSLLVALLVCCLKEWMGYGNR